MAIKKKKKKKKEFDASLMGEYLPSARAVVNPEPVSAITKLIYSAPPFISWRWRYMPAPGTGDYTPSEPRHDPLGGFMDAWIEYAFGAGVYSLFSQPPQAYLLTKAGLYPTFRVGLAFEFIGGTIIVATLATIIDPLHKWEGGLDETAFYQRRVTNAVRKPEWASNDPWYWKAKEEHGWGASL